MALRSFLDTKGITWNVWNVVPQTRTSLVANPGGHDPAHPLTPGLEDGWLCFECRDEKRRLSPVPGDWEGCSDDELERLLLRAAQVPKRQRPLLIR